MEAEIKPKELPDGLEQRYALKEIRAGRRCNLFKNLDICDIIWIYIYRTISDALFSLGPDHFDIRIAKSLNIKPGMRNNCSCQCTDIIKKDTIFYSKYICITACFKKCS